MHQFIGDLIASGNTSKDQPDVLNAAWGLAAVAAAAGGGGVGGGSEALGFKGASLGPPQQPRPAQDKPEAEIRPGASSQRKGEARDGRGQRSKQIIFFQTFI